MAGLKFFKDSEIEASADLSDAKIIVYEDGGSNKYTLDASSIDSLNKIDDLKLSNLLKGEVKFKYQLKDSTQVEEITGLGNIIGKLFATKSATDGKTVLAEEVTKEPVVKAIFAAKDTTGKKLLVDEIKDKDVAGAILGATSDKDGKKSILVEKLGEFLSGTDAVYESKTAKAFLESKALGSAITTDSSAVASKLLDGTNKTTLVTAILDVKDGNNPKLETALAGNETLQNAVAENTTLQTAVAENTTLQTAVAENTTLQTAVAENTTLQTAVATNEGLKAVLAKPADIAAISALQDAVATQLLADDNKTKLVNEIASKETLKNAVVTDDTFKGAVTSKLAKPDEIAQVKALQQAVADNSGLQTAVKNALADDNEFKDDVRITAHAQEEGFQGAVREVVSQPVFDTPADENTSFSWDW